MVSVNSRLVSWKNHEFNRLPVLIFQQFVVYLFNVNFLPQDIIIAVHVLDDSVVQAVKLLKQSQFLSDSLQVRIFGDSQTKQLLATLNVIKSKSGIKKRKKKHQQQKHDRRIYLFSNCSFGKLSHSTPGCYACLKF